MRRLLAVILLLSFVCQAFVMARQLVVFDHEGAFQAAHAEMHLEGSAHHHGEHGVAHKDDSQESIQHMLAELASWLRGEEPSSTTIRPRPASSRRIGDSAFSSEVRRPPRKLTMPT